MKKLFEQYKGSAVVIAFDLSHRFTGTVGEATDEYVEVEPGEEEGQHGPARASVYIPYASIRVVYFGK
jgi:hypothetical protein